MLQRSVSRQPCCAVGGTQRGAGEGASPEAWQLGGREGRRARLAPHFQRVQRVGNRVLSGRREVLVSTREGEQPNWGHAETTTRLEAAGQRASHRVRPQV